MDEQLEADTKQPGRFTCQHRPGAGRKWTPPSGRGGAARGRLGLRGSDTDTFEAAHWRRPGAFPKSHVHCGSASPEPHGLRLSENRGSSTLGLFSRALPLASIVGAWDSLPPHPLLVSQPLTEGSSGVIVLRLDYKRPCSPFCELYKNDQDILPIPCSPSRNECP